MTPVERVQAEMVKVVDRYWALGPAVVVAALVETAAAVVVFVKQTDPDRAGDLERSLTALAAFVDADGAD